MKRVFGNCLLALGLIWLLMLIWLTPVAVRTSDGISEPIPINWAVIIMNLAIIGATLWAGVALRRSGRLSS